MRPRRDRPRGPDRLRGRARRAARHGRRRYRLRTTDDERAPRDLPPRSRASRASRAATGCRFARRRGGGRRAVARARRGRASAMRALVPDAATLEELFFALTEDRRPPATADRRRPRRSRDAAPARRLRLGAAQARRPEAHLPRPRRRDARAADLRRRAGRAERRGPNDKPFGRYVRETGLAIPLVLLFFGSIWLFPLITALVAGRHRRRRGRQRDAEDDPHALASTAGRCSSPRSLAALTYALLALVVMVAAVGRRRRRSLGLRPAHALSGTTVSAPARALLLVLASLGVYLLPLSAIAAIGAPALDGHAQLRRAPSSAR